MVDKCSVTCAIALHREGLLAHTSLTSIAQARERAEAEGFSVEFVITLDNHDDFTEKTLRKHHGIRSDDVIEVVHYGDLGLSRNHAISRASGEYIVCMDGDDYYSSNYIAIIVREAMRGNNVVAYPEYLFSFDAEYHYVRLGGPEDRSKNSYAMFSEHHYCSRIAAHRDVFLRIPYVRCGKGFGFEDWHWSAEARAAGLEHRVARSAVLFYRRKAVSMGNVYVQENAIIPPSRFFETLPKPKEGDVGSPLTVPAAPFPWKAIMKSMVFNILRLLPNSRGDRLYTLLRDWDIHIKQGVFSFLKRLPPSLAGKLHARLARHWRALTRPGNFLEPVIREALLEVAKTDGLLHPDRLPPVSRFTFTNDEAPGRAYAAAWYSLPRHDYDIVYTVPSIRVGGADLMTLNYMKTMCAVGKRVLCITTGGEPNRPGGLPPEVDVLDLGAYIRTLRQERQIAILTRLLVQLAPDLTHMVNDSLGFKSVLRHGQALRQRSKLFVSIFADGQDNNNIYYGAGTEFLRGLYPHIVRAITDNTVTARNWARRFGFDEHFFHPVYGMIAAQGRSWGSPVSRDRVLWAGRLDAEKRLDIAYEIAKQLPEVQFDFYGRPVLDTTNPAIETLKTLPNVAFFGEYDGFSSLPTEKYFAFLYTTQCDGLPNVLLEATAEGLSVIAPDRGGIRDFLTDDTGWLVPSHTDIPAYVLALRRVRDDSREAKTRWERAYALLAARHNEASFTRALLNAYNSEKAL